MATRRKPVSALATKKHLVRLWIQTLPPLIAGAALFMFGTGPIKGFAVVHVLRHSDVNV